MDSDIPLNILNRIDRIISEQDQWKDYFISKIVGDIPDWLPPMFESLLYQIAERMTFPPNVTAPLSSDVVRKSLEGAAPPASVMDVSQYFRDIAFLEYVKHGTSLDEKHGMRYLLGQQGAEDLAKKQTAAATEARSNKKADVKAQAQREALLYWSTYPAKKQPTIKHVTRRLVDLHGYSKDQIPNGNNLWRYYLKEVLPNKS